MEINWDDVKESSFIDQEGTYTLKIKSFEEKETANGNACHVYECVTRDGEKIKLSLYLAEKALWKYKAFLKACGLNPTGVVDSSTLGNALVGKKFIGEVKRQAPRPNIETGELEESKYFEVAKFYPLPEREEF